MLLLLLGIYNSVYSQLRISVLSDTHIMASDVLKEEGSAFDDYISHDRKMLKESSSLLKLCVGRLIEDNPNIVLICGDLTKDGELSSHKKLKDELLVPLFDRGIKVFVIPGNHDVNNPHAVEFINDTTRRILTVSPDGFADIYKDCGYGDAISRDESSLSYVVQLTDSLRLLCIDACRYQENNFEKNICVTGGRILPGTMDFIRTEADKAKQDGCKMIAMMHHGIVEHWKWQGKIMGDYLIDNWKKTAREFIGLGINVVFTGHFHAQDVTCLGKGDKKIYDVQTGSTVSFPLPYRNVVLEENKLYISTEYIENLINNKGEYKEFQYINKKARDFAIAGIGNIVRDMLPESVPDSVASKAAEMLGEAYALHLYGDESFNDEYKNRLKEICKLLRKYSLKYSFILKRVSEYMATDLNTSDNTLTIEI